MDDIAGADINQVSGLVGNSTISHAWPAFKWEVGGGGGGGGGQRTTPLGLYRLARYHGDCNSFACTLYW